MSLRNAFTQGEPIIEIDGNFMKIQNTQHIDGDLKVQLNALSRECFGQDHVAVPNEILYAIVDLDKDMHIIGAFLSVYIEDFENGYCSIWNVCTSSRFRRRGLMRRLFTIVMTNLKRMGALKIKLHVVHHNPQRDMLMNMYRKYGFEVSDWDKGNMIMTWRRRN